MPDPTARGELDRRRAARREVVLDALAAGVDYSEAAALGTCSARTVRRLVSDPQFAAELAERRGHRVIALTGRLSSLQDRAIDTLVEVLSAEKAVDRQRAATILLSVGERLRAATDVELRLTWQEHALRKLLTSTEDQRRGGGRR
jgi:hypothetical protein